ncbi:hypothetical protein F4808DRAFT_457655 [Astrocystis sublimbata]|nr:hypothetical protein F4808DRAFT_457655 [Astrocystis sublimbata]
MSSPQIKTFTVPVGTRLSHGIELEMLVAYLYTSEPDPDDLHSKVLAPILRVAVTNTDENNAVDRARMAKEIAKEHIRNTLRTHGIRVNAPGPVPATEDVPDHLQGVDQWDVATDVTVGARGEEAELSRGKPGSYRWLGLELRSPACWDGSRAYDEIRYVVNLMKSSYRVRVNDTCGLHVHVANGPRYFSAQTLKRAGAFFYAADPMLSRLHAPWRRISEWAPSLRYVSRLARLDPTIPLDENMPQGASAALFRRDIRPPLVNPTREYLPVLPWSDRSREEKDFGGRKNKGLTKWQTHANERVRDGPHITLGERPSTPELSEGSEENDVSRPPSVLSSSSSLVDDYFDDHEGGSHYRYLLRLMEESVFIDACWKRFGVDDPQVLDKHERYELLILVMCEHIFGHDKPNSLSDEQYYQLIVACAPFIEISRSTWDWNADRNEFSLKDAPLGYQLNHPCPKTLNQTNVRDIIDNLETLASIQEDDGERRAEQHDEDTWDDASKHEDEDEDADDEEEDEDEENDAILSDKDAIKRGCYETRDRLMEQYNFHFEDSDDIQDMFTDSWGSDRPLSSSTNSGFNTPSSSVLKAANPNQHMFQTSGTLNSTSSVGNIADNGGASPGKTFRVPSTPSSADSNAHSAENNDGDPMAFVFPKPATSDAPSVSSSFTSLSDSSDSGGAFNPPAFEAYMAPQKDSIQEEDDSKDDEADHRSRDHEAPGGHQSSGRISRGPKLEPHDIYSLPYDYIQRITLSKRFGEAQWNRISWLPYRGGPSDPEETHPRGEGCDGPNCPHVTTDTRSGLATLLGVDSGAAVGELFVSRTPSQRPNYNFTAYELDSLKLDGWRRTIEFRESGGSLDPDWITCWASICVGILRFCRDASVLDFITVVERVAREEERRRHSNRNKHRDGTIYDVCDLLEDMCLFAEAAKVRERERILGPPR